MDFFRKFAELIEKGIMAAKDTSPKKGFFSNWIVRNLVAAAIFLAVLLIGVAVGLNIITRHNQTVTAPDFTNMTVQEAEEAAQAAHVSVKVTDSVFVSRLAGGVVFRQSPKAGATVKKGRSIFLTINSFVPRKVVMPNLVGYSLIEARSELGNRGLSVGRLNYVRDMATNRVLGQSFRGRELKPGDLVVSGSPIDLTLGLSSEDNSTVVPRLVGMKYIRAVDALHEHSLNVGRARFDADIRTYADSTNAVVYKQDAAGAYKMLGTAINIYLTLDPSKVPAE